MSVTEFCICTNIFSNDVLIVECLDKGFDESKKQNKKQTSSLYSSPVWLKAPSP